MLGCLSCGAACEVGVLCRTCARAVTPATGLIPEHIRSTTADDDAAAWVVDGFGIAHALAAKTTIGREPASGLVILAPSVSREHAELKRTGAAWQLRDLGSRNGSQVDGMRTQGRASLTERTTIRIGEIALWFLAQPPYQPTRGAPHATGSVAGGVTRYAFGVPGVELCILGSSDVTSGGSLLVKAGGKVTWSEHALPPLEFQLLRTLCARAVAEAEVPTTVRGCVGTKQLARDLPFQSKYANEENVRQVVRRLRGVLADVGADGVVAVVPGRGYYIASPVTVGAAPAL